MNLPKRVLIVDDNECNLEVYHEILDSEYFVLQAENGRDAIRLAARFQPRIVILDVMLPDLDGYEICRMLRHMADMHDALIVMVSAKAMPSECAAGLHHGADFYLTKPFDEAELRAALRVPHLAIQ